MMTVFHRQFIVQTISYIVTVLVFGNISFGQTFQRLNNETAEQFVTRLKPDSSEITHKVIETKIWDTTKNIIIVFYSLSDKRNLSKGYEGQSTNIFIGYLFIPTNDLNYKRILIDTLDDFYNQKIEAVFFCNADKDKSQELAILLSSEMNPWTSKCSGTAYNTYFYVKPDSFATTGQLKLLKDISNKFYGCDCDCKNDYHETAKFKTATDIKKELKQLGYN